MAIERTAGRIGQRGDFNFPTRCTALAFDPMQPCEAEFEKSARCLGCMRSGGVPACPGFSDLPICEGAPTVYVKQLNLGSARWLVITKTARGFVDTRFPPVACRSRIGAFDMAFLRAQQIDPNGAIVGPLKVPLRWKVGGVLVRVLEARSSNMVSGVKP